MTNKEVIEQLKSLIEHCWSMRDKEDPDTPWERDCEALDFAIKAVEEKESTESAIDWWRKKTEAEPIKEKRAGMTYQEASQILQEEANGIPSDLYDKNTERFKEAVRIATQALNTMPFIQDMSDTIDRLRAENQVAPVEMIEGQTDCVTEVETRLKFEGDETMEQAIKDRQNTNGRRENPLPVEIEITEQDQRQLAASIVSTMPRIIETMADALPRIIEVAIEAIDKMPPEELIRIATSRSEEAE